MKSMSRSSVAYDRLRVAYILRDGRRLTSTGWSKNGHPVLFWDNFGNSAPILTILLLLQAEIYGA